MTREKSLKRNKSRNDSDGGIKNQFKTTILSKVKDLKENTNLRRETKNFGVPTVVCSGLMIQHCLCSGTGHFWGVGSIPGLETSIWHGCGQKRKKNIYWLRTIWQLPCYGPRLESSMKVQELHLWWLGFSLRFLIPLPIYSIFLLPFLWIWLSLFPECFSAFDGYSQIKQITQYLVKYVYTES